MCPPAYKSDMQYFTYHILVSAHPHRARYFDYFWTWKLRVCCYFWHDPAENPMLAKYLSIVWNVQLTLFSVLQMAVVTEMDIGTNLGVAMSILPSKQGVSAVFLYFTAERTEGGGTMKCISCSNSACWKYPTNTRRIIVSTKPESGFIAKRSFVEILLTRQPRKQCWLIALGSWYLEVADLFDNRQAVKYSHTPYSFESLQWLVRCFE